MALRIRTDNQGGGPVLDFCRCAMIPLRDPEAAPVTPTASTPIPAGSTPRRWPRRSRRLAPRRFRGGRRRALRDLALGGRSRSPGGTSSLGAPELARLSLNVARPTRSRRRPPGRRLVYGGHTIGLAGAQATRALPGPGRGRRLARLRPPRARLRGGHAHDRARAGAGRAARGEAAHCCDLRSRVSAGADGDDGGDVLDWRFVAVMARRRGASPADPRRACASSRARRSSPRRSAG